MTSDGLPRCELAVSLPLAATPTWSAWWAGGDHPSGIPALVMALIPGLCQPGGAAQPGLLHQDVYPAGCASPAALLSLAQGVVNAARHLHGRGILHGDLCP